jgi:signal transduction histidine kinase
MDSIDERGDDPGLRHQDRWITVGFWSGIAFAVALALVSGVAMRAVIRSLSDVAFEDSTNLIAVQRLQIAEEVKGRKARSFLVTENPEHLSAMNSANREITYRLATLRRLMTRLEDTEILDRIESADSEYQSALDRVIALRKGAADIKTVGLAFELEVQPTRDDLGRAFLDLAALQERRLQEATREAQKTVSHALKLLFSLAGFTLLLSILLGFQLTHALRARRKQHMEMAHHLEKLEELNRELDSFAGRVSHDLRNLLSPIGLNASLLLRSLDKPDRIQSLTVKIQRSIDRSLAMMDGLLAFSKSGTPDPLATCSVVDVVNEVAEQLEPLVTRIGATLDRRVEDVEIACSRELLNVVALNLLGNALKFMEGCEQRVVSISARAGVASCELTFADTGPGIPDAALGRIFEPFYRVPGAKAPGTGIGLATVARIVETHGGRIAVDSKPGRGTIFKVHLPMPSASTGSPRLTGHGLDGPLHR